MFFIRNYTTKQHERWWKKRKKDWSKEFDTWQHPHRKIIINFLRLIKWDTLLEIGCGTGPNLALISHFFKGKLLAGTDINQEALDFATTKFKNISLRNSSLTDIFMSDKGVQVVLSDMSLLYIGPRDIMKVLNEIKRVATSYVLLCEFNHRNWFKRQWLRIRSGQHAYNYRKLLNKLDFYDITEYKLTEDFWPEMDKTQKEFATIILAKIP